LYAGLLPAGAGKSHQSLRDISLLSSIPNFRIFQPVNYIEVFKILNHCIFREKNNCAIRLSIGPPPKKVIETTNNISFQNGKGSILGRGKKVLIFAYGQYMINEVLKLNKILNKKKIIPKIINMSCLNNFNKEWLKGVVRDCKYIFAIDDHSIVGGLGDNLQSELNNLKLLKNKFYFKIGLDILKKIALHGN
jgi:transketolase